MKFQKDRTKPVSGGGGGGGGGSGGLRSLSYSTPHFTNEQTHFNSLILINVGRQLIKKSPYREKSMLVFIACSSRKSSSESVHLSSLASAFAIPIQNISAIRRR